MGAKFGGYARKIRLDKGITMKAVADALEFSSAYVSDIEQGYRNPPSSDRLRRWAELIGVNPEEFIEEAESDVKVVELPVGEEVQAELAHALRRRWTSLTDDDMKRILKALSQ
jgi:transcriptional regulator with XRE-family HTH domain